MQALVSAVNHNDTASLPSVLFPFSSELIKQKMMFVDGPHALGSLSGQVVILCCSGLQFFLDSMAFQPNIRPTKLQDALNSILKYQNAEVQVSGMPSSLF